MLPGTGRAEGADDPQLAAPQQGPQQQMPAVPPRPAPPPGPPPPNAQQPSSREGTRSGQSQPPPLSMGAPVGIAGIAPSPPVGMPPAGALKPAPPGGLPPARQAQPAQGQRQRPPAMTMVGGAESPRTTYTPTPPATAPPPVMAGARSAPNSVSSTPVSAAPAAHGSMIVEGEVTAEPQSIMDALRRVAEPLCRRMPNAKQADDTRKKLQALEWSLKEGSVKEDMRKLVAALLRNLGAGDRQEAEKTQRSIAQMAFDAGENSPPWVQATSRLVLQLKAGIAVGSNPATPKSAAAPANTSDPSGAINLSNPSTPSSGSIFSGASSSAMGSQPPTPSTALGVDETQRTTATPVASHIVPPAANPAPFMPVNNAVQPSSAAPAASTAPSAAVNAPTRAAVTHHSHAHSPQAPDSKVPPSDSFDDDMPAQGQKGHMGLQAPLSAPGPTIGAADQPGLRRRTGAVGGEVKGENVDRAHEAKGNPAPPSRAGTTSAPGKVGRSVKARSTGCGTCCTLIVLLSLVLLGGWIGWLALCETKGARAPGSSDLSGGAVSREESGVVEVLLKSNGLGQYASAMADLGLLFVADLAKVTDDDIKTLLMKPIHANKLRHLRDKETERQAAAAPAAPVDEDLASAPGPPAPPAVCAQAREVGTQIARAVGEYIGHDTVASILQPLMGVHAAAMAPEAAHLRRAASQILSSSSDLLSSAAGSAGPAAASILSSASDIVNSAGLPTASISAIEVPALDVEDAKGVGWLLVKGLLVVLQVLTFPVWSALEGCSSALVYARHEALDLWSKQVMLL